ncbi:hypothetical protein ACJRO7_001760 [Eucalyptus globulus]|uniref:Uncharacterized protein n=1 Tax=Eucalyptus globulus TaxID=34317 RepID=A0ABD3LS20_EUCGL
MGRAPCCDKNGLKKGPWTPEEDLKLINYIQAHGPGNWRTLPKNAGLQRCGKSCRLRWTNYLRPDIKRGRFSFEEEETIIQLHSILGNKWSAIAARLPGRTDNEIKNYWNTHIRKRLLRNGIDPVTHAPRLDLLDLSSLLSSSLCNPPLINMANLLKTQALLNPELLRLASTILSLKNENPDLLSQNNLQENHISDPNAFPLSHSNQFQVQAQSQAQQVPACTTSTLPCGPLVDQAQLGQANVGDFPSNLPSNFSCSNTGQIIVPPMESQDLVSQPHYIQGNSSPAMPASLEKLCHFQPNNGDDQNFRFDSIMSTPLSSSTPLNSSSTFVNSSSEEERESYCSSFFKFELPESLDINDFMC